LRHEVDETLHLDLDPAVALAYDLVAGRTEAVSLVDASSTIVAGDGSPVDQIPS
jgi:hypothetical protein